MRAKVSGVDFETVNGSGGGGGAAAAARPEGVTLLVKGNSKTLGVTVDHCTRPGNVVTACRSMKISSCCKCRLIFLLTWYCRSWRRSV